MLKPRIVPQPFEDRRKLRGLVAHWQQQVAMLSHDTASMDYRMAHTMLTWLLSRQRRAELWWSDRQEFKRQHQANYHSEEYRRIKQDLRKWEREQTLG